MQTPVIAHRCGRAYGPDSSQRALAVALAGGRLAGIETDVCITRDGALVCLHDAYLPLATTVTGWAHERSAAEVLAGRLLDGLGRASGERPLLVDELLDLWRRGSRCSSTSRPTPTRRWRGGPLAPWRRSWRDVLTAAGRRC